MTDRDVRHFADYRGAYYGVFDKTFCFSAINIDINHLKLDELLSMLYTDDPVIADYLIQPSKPYGSSQPPHNSALTSSLNISVCDCCRAASEGYFLRIVQIIEIISISCLLKDWAVRRY